MKKILGLMFLSMPTVLSAGVCDYRPSALIGSGASGVVAATSASVAVAGAGAKAAGFYTLTHAVTGATMLGSTAGGASAAGTVGIMGGTAGVLGTVGSIILAPATIITGLVVGAGIAVMEGGCYFAVDRIDDPYEVMAIVQNIANNADPSYFSYIPEGRKVKVASKFSDDKDRRPVDWEVYEIKNMYIEDGNLRHRDWGINSNLGKVGFIAPEKTE